MLGFFLVALLLLSWRMLLSQGTADISLSLDSIVSYSQELQRLRTDKQRLTKEEQLYTTGKVSDASESRIRIRRTGLDSLGCGMPNGDLVIPRAEFDRAGSIGNLSDSEIMDLFCKEERELIAQFSLLDDFIKLRPKPGEPCPEIPADLFGGLERATAPTMFATFDSSAAISDAQEDSCKINWDYLSEYRDIANPDALPDKASLAKEIKALIVTSVARTKERLDEIPREIGELTKEEEKVQELLAAANETDQPWPSLLARNSREILLNALLSIITLLGVNAGYRLNRAHNFEIVQIRRREANLEALEKFKLDALLSERSLRRLVDAGGPNPFSLNSRDGEVKSPQAHVVQVATRQLEGAIRSLAAAAKSLRGAEDR